MDACRGSWLTALLLLLPAASLGAGAAAPCRVEKEGRMPDGAGATAGRTRMPVVHQYGPWSTPLADEIGKLMPLHEEILAADQRRVQSIHRRAMLPPSSTSSSSGDLSSSEQPLMYTSKRQASSSGSALNTGYYVVPISLGTPAEQFAVALDTGSDTTWVKCQPCSGNCSHKGERFSPANSSTYANIPCRSPSCSDLDRMSMSCNNNICSYSLRYYDDSYTTGYYAHDTLTLGEDTVKDFRFGCSTEKTWGLLGQSSGVLGLGRGKSSLMVQAQAKYGGVFSYCLPADPTETGFLDLGHRAEAANDTRLMTTPMFTNKGALLRYHVRLTGIKVGGHLLPIDGSVFSTAGTIMDSGTIITRLPPSAYKPLASAFAGDMEVLGYERGPAFYFLDTCFNLTGHQGVIPLPTVSLVFQGNATLDVDASGILYVANISCACLAFASNHKDTDMAVIGSTQQKTYGVSYDPRNEVIGFSPGAC